MKRCFIFGALDVHSLPVPPNDGDMLIAADKGILSIKKFGLSPDVIIGDFDSLGLVPDGENVIRLPIEKDDTDIGYAIRYALEHGTREFYIYGACGGMLDHTVANLQHSLALAGQNIFAVFFGDEFSFCSVRNGRLIFPENANGRLSVFARQVCRGVKIKNAKYTLNGASLSPDFPLGVSNSFIGKSAEISVSDGVLTVIWQGEAIPYHPSSEAVSKS